MNQGFIEALRQTLPPTFSRQVADSKGEGPGGVRLGRCVAYERESFLAWLERRINTPSGNKRLGGYA